MESQPRNPEFRNNPENCYPRSHSFYSHYGVLVYDIRMCELGHFFSEHIFVLSNIEDDDRRTQNVFT